MSTTAPLSSAPRLERPREGRMIFGVSAGIARHLNIDPTLVRVAFIVAAVAGGFGFAAYVAAFLLIPEEGSDVPPFRRFGSHRAATIAGIALLGIAALSTIDSFDGHGVARGVIWACVLAGAGGFLLVRSQGDTAPVETDAATRSRPTVAIAGALLLVGAGVAAAAAAGVDIGWQEGAAIALIAAGGVLVVGAFVGASPWLAFPPLFIAAVVGALVAAGAAFDGPIGEREFVPASAQQLPHEYRVAIGELTVDLRDVELPTGTTHVKVRVGIGEAHVIVPRGVGLHVVGHTGAGDVRLPGGQSDGTDVDREETIAAPDRPVLDLEVRAGLGDVHVERAS